MLVSLNWLRQYADLEGAFSEHDIEQIAHKYSTYTAEVDEIIDHNTYSPLVIGRVIDTQEHENADTLTVVQVDCWEHGNRQIVCWAANVVDAQYVAVALPGCKMAPDFEIATCKLRWVTSEGMICGADEIGLSGVKEKTIWQLEETFAPEYLMWKIGNPVFELTLTFPLLSWEWADIRLGDTVFDLDNKFITNRPDLFGIYGNAREMGCLFRKELVSFTENVPLQEVSKSMNVHIEAPQAVSVYTLMRYENVEVKRSPFIYDMMLSRTWHAVFNNFVDATNLVMTELAQPMHVFDADTIEGDISVRYAKSWESFLALDDITYELSDTDLIIADNEKVLALAWVIWGKSSSVTQETKNIFVESATFDGVGVRATSQRLGIRTDSSVRFEKGQTNAHVLIAQERFRSLIAYTGAAMTPVDSFQHITKEDDVDVSLEHAYLEKRAGITISSSEASDVLERLWFSVSYDNGIYSCQVPSWRAQGDVSIPEDLIEEIVRMIGYENIPATPLVWELTTVHVDAHIGLQKSLSEAFLAHDIHDVYTYTFTNEKRQALFQPDKSKWIGVTQPFSEEHSVMRVSLFDALFELTKDHKRTHEKFWFFEYGAIFEDGDEEQNYQCGCVFQGYSSQEVRDVLGSILPRYLHNGEGQWGDITISQGSDHPQLHPRKSGVLMYNNVRIAEYGYIHPSYAAEYGISVDTLLCEIYTDATWLEAYKKFSALSKFPTIQRELAFVMKEETTTQDVVQIIQASHTDIQDVNFIDAYRHDEKVGTGMKSLNFSCTFGRNDATLTDEEAGAIQHAIIDVLTKHDIHLRA